MIKFNQVSKNFAAVAVFKNINVFLPKASYTHISGSSGSGKSTLLQMIMAYEKPSLGTLTVDNMDITSLPNERIPFLRRQIGLVETNPLLLENRTVAENIAVPLRIGGFDSKALQERVSISLQELALDTISDVPVQRLDSDQRRLVACARACVHRPGIILVDTPETQLRESTELTQTELLKKMRKTGTTVVVAKHESDTCTGLPTGATALAISNGKINPHESFEYVTGE